MKKSKLIRRKIIQLMGNGKIKQIFETSGLEKDVINRIMRTLDKSFSYCGSRCGLYCLSNDTTKTVEAPNKLQAKHLLNALTTNEIKCLIPKDLYKKEQNNEVNS